jgi:4-hydroxy-tetrahydrodipicolinate synthase
MTSGAPRGVLSALVTPYNSDGRIDEAALSTLLDFQIGAGVDGLFILGTSGEGLLLTDEERMMFAETALALVDNRVPVVVHCGATNTASAVGLARHAADCGASLIASLPPLFFPYTDASQLTHFSAIVQAAPDADHFLYDIPERTGYTLGPELVMTLFREVPQLRGIKDTGDSMARLIGYLSMQPEPPLVYTGNNVLLFPALMMGAAGAVSTMANATPELFAAVVTAYRESRYDDARKLQLTIALLQRAVAGLPYIASVKHLLARRGLPGSRPRTPLPDLTGDQRRTLDARIDRDRALVEWLKLAA